MGILAYKFVSTKSFQSLLAKTKLRNSRTRLFWLVVAICFGCDSQEHRMSVSKAVCDVGSTIEWISPEGAGSNKIVVAAGMSFNKYDETSPNLHISCRSQFRMSGSSSVGKHLYVSSSEGIGILYDIPVEWQRFPDIEVEIEDISVSEDEQLLAIGRSSPACGNWTLGVTVVRRSSGNLLFSMERECLPAFSAKGMTLATLVGDTALDEAPCFSAVRLRTFSDSDTDDDDQFAIECATCLSKVSGTNEFVIGNGSGEVAVVGVDGIRSSQNVSEAATVAVSGSNDHILAVTADHNVYLLKPVGAKSQQLGRCKGRPTCCYLGERYAWVGDFLGSLYAFELGSR